MKISRIRSTLPSPSVGRLGVWLLAAVLACVPTMTARPLSAAVQSTFVEEGGTLPDGTSYLMRVPPNWTGTVIRDLDYTSAARSDDRSRNRSYLLERGYAMIGTGRHPLRALRWDPAVEIANLDTWEQAAVALA